MNANQATGFCANCGAHEQLHQIITNACPSGGVEETRPGNRQEWQETVFEDKGIKDFEQRAVNNFDSVLQALKKAHHFIYRGANLFTMEERIDLEKTLEATIKAAEQQ